MYTSDNPLSFTKLNALNLKYNFWRPEYLFWQQKMKTWGPAGPKIFLKVEHCSGVIMAACKQCIWFIWYNFIPVLLRPECTNPTYYWSAYMHNVQSNLCTTVILGKWQGDCYYTGWQLIQVSFVENLRPLKILGSCTVTIYTGWLLYTGLLYTSLTVLPGVCDPWWKRVINLWKFNQ